LVSFILVFSNNKSELESCIYSILKSGLSPEVYEIIIIDECIREDISQFVNKLCAENTHVFYFKQKDKRVSAAKNLGLALAKNKYIWYVDTDNLIRSEFLLDMVYEIVNNDLDTLGVNYSSISENESIFSKSRGVLNSGGKKFIAGGEFYDLNFKQNYIGQYIFRKEIFLANEIKFREDLDLDDSDILPRLMANIYRMGIFEIPVYVFSRGNNRKVTTGSDSEEAIIKSTILLAESIKGQVQQFSTYKGLAEGLIKKSKQVNQILFHKFINGNWSKDQRINLILEMKSRGIFPFLNITHPSLLKRIGLNSLRHLVNLRPVSVSHIYAQINRNDK
jgi:glycosyltransferase involved in cell wall biosynthesis